MISSRPDWISIEKCIEIVVDNLKLFDFERINVRFLRFIFNTHKSHCVNKADEQKNFIVFIHNEQLEELEKIVSFVQNSPKTDDQCTFKYNYVTFVAIVYN